MSPEQHQRVRKVFDEAVEKPLVERPAFLDSACAGDAELRQAVERLLEAHRNSDDFLSEGKTSERRLGRYILNRELGRGSMGVVFEGIDPLIGRHVAVKVIRIDPSTEAGPTGTVRDQFFREAHSAGQLLHPGIVVIFDVGQQGDAAFIAMEMVEGPSLQDLLTANPCPPLAETMEILRQAAAALDYAHQNGIVHRDIKPANIMLHKGRTVKIADFGVAKINSLQNLTATGMILGTPTYMSPEQLEMQPLDGRSDQFSLAVVAYEMCTGNRPFEAPSLAPLTHMIVYGERPSARAANPALTAAADAVLRKGLSKLPADRYRNCVEFVAALGNAVRDAPAASPVVVAPPPVIVAPPAPAPVMLPPAPTVPPAPFVPPDVPTVQSAVFRPIAQPLAPELPPTAPSAPVVPTMPPTMPPAVPPQAAPGRRNSGMFWLLAAFLAVAAMLGGAVWVYQSTPWKSRLADLIRPKKAPASAPAATSPQPPSPQPATSPAAAPTVALFAAAPESVAAGTAATLHWEVKDATAVRIEPEVGKVAASGAVPVQPAVSTTYTLTATGPGGEGTARVSVEVLGKAAAPVPINTAKSLYENGLTDRRAGNNEKALAAFRQAAELGDVRAMLEVAEDGLDSDNGESERWFRKAAELGDSTAMLNLGAMYQLGNHVKEDYAQAVFWYRKAADKGNPSAMYNLGRMYERGLGVPKDLSKSKELYQKAAAKGNSDARIRLDQLPDK